MFLLSVGLIEFIEEYKGRLLRINDRENHIFMEALLKHINDE